MSLRNQPFFPMYVDDFLTDEKLNECSAKAHGVYIKLMCLMHKSDEYGKILLKQKDKILDNQVSNFASKLVKHFPFPKEEIESGLQELLNENVIYLDGDYLCQKRMIKDNKISEIRTNSGKKGGNPSLKKEQKKEVLLNQNIESLDNQIPNQKHVIENEYGNGINNDLKEEEGLINGEFVFPPPEYEHPSLEKVIFYFTESGYSKEDAENFWSYYNGLGWEIKGQLIKTWTSKVIGWMNNSKNFKRDNNNGSKAATNRESKKQFKVIRAGDRNN